MRSEARDGTCPVPKCSPKTPRGKKIHASPKPRQGEDSGANSNPSTLQRGVIPSPSGRELFSRHKDSVPLFGSVAARVLMTMGTEPIPCSDALSLLLGFQRSHPGSVNKMTGLDGSLPSRDAHVCLREMTQANIATGSAALKW